MSVTEAPRFNTDRPAEVRDAPRWSRLAYVVRALPKAIAALAPQLLVPSGGRVLDYGCADRPYRQLLPADAEYVPADLPGNPQALVAVQPDGTVPLPGDSFDAVLSTQVLEHAQDPETYLAECFRVLRPGGRMLLSTHGIMVWHPDPVDHWRWTCGGLRHAVEQAGFEVVRFEGVVGLAATGIQLFQDSAIYSLPRFLRKPFAFVMQALMGVADRFQSAESRRYNALVFALIAEKPL
ncbi:MAG TPA: class I SAM-dependent methyltransferase [Thermoleophilaceae bacterium]